MDTTNSNSLFFLLYCNSYRKGPKHALFGQLKKCRLCLSRWLPACLRPVCLSQSIPMPACLCPVCLSQSIPRPACLCPVCLPQSIPMPACLGPVCLPQSNPMPACLGPVCLGPVCLLLCIPLPSCLSGSHLPVLIYSLPACLCSVCVCLFPNIFLAPCLQVLPPPCSY